MVEEEKAAQVAGAGRALGQKARSGEEEGRAAKRRRRVVGLGRRVEAASGSRAVNKAEERRSMAAATSA